MVWVMSEYENKHTGTSILAGLLLLSASILFTGILIAGENADGALGMVGFLNAGLFYLMGLGAIKKLNDRATQ